MKQLPFPLSIIAVFLFSLLYWLYLASTTSMVICWDSIGYRDLGHLLQTQGLIAYFKTGPNREPLYPLLVMLSMQLASITTIAYTKIMTLFGVILLFLTQLLTFKILRLLNMRNSICIFVLAYLALSPALNNSAFSLYSEIAVLPFILGIILTSYYAQEAIKQNKKAHALAWGASLGILFTAATFVKAVFECIAPAYLIIFLAMVFLTDKDIKMKKMTAFLLCLIAGASFYYVPITTYKWLNNHYNGNFVITNRGSWALYGNTARRMEPLTFKKFAEALAYAPGEGVCNSIFGATECDFWSYRKSDEFGYGKQNELTQEHLSPEKINVALLNLSAQKALHNPFQYALLTLTEGSKMFFWESTQIGFVDYPHWLQQIYGFKLFNNSLRFLVSLLTWIAVVSLFTGKWNIPNSPIRFLIGLLICLYILFFSFFFILTRYALPIAPLYLIVIAIWLEQKLTPKKQIEI